MIDRLSSHWKEACELINYTYAEDLGSWVCPGGGIVNISTPFLDRILPGDVICMNSINYAYLFLFDMLRHAILDYLPLAMLSTTQAIYDFHNRMLFCFLNSEYERDEEVLERLSARAILSKRLRAKRFCEVEDELEILSQKGYKTIILTYGTGFPYLDAESLEKGYGDHYDALKKVASKYGLSLIVFASHLARKIDGMTTIKVWPERNRLILAPPEEVTVTVNGEKQYRFHIENDSRLIAGFRFKGRQVILARKQE